MDERTLTTDEKRLLEEETENSKQGRQRNIKKGLIIVLVSLTVALLTSMIERSGLSQQVGRLIGAVTAISISVAVFGLLNLYYWFRTAKKSIDEFDMDIRSGNKLSGRLKITGYNYFSREIKLDNGVCIDRYNLGDNWKKGDYLDIEYLPKSLYILKCDKNAR